MKVLHICNDLFGSQVHANLYRRLAEAGLRQVVYAPIRKGVVATERLLAETPLIVDRIVKPYHRFLYFLKRRTIYRSMTKQVDLSDCDLIHATTLFSDGGVAYRAYQERHIPYYVTVRNTDVNFFLRMTPHLWFTGWRILLHAKRILFVSPSMRERFTKSWAIRPILSRIQDKFITRANGVEDFWCDHVRREATRNHKILFVGELSEMKNMSRLILSVADLRREAGFEDVTLTLVGSMDRSTPRIRSLIEREKEWVTYLGVVKNREQLCDIYREHSIFAMPSLYETFGLVFVEALSQNLAILYTKGQGVDGLFDPTVGRGVDPTSVADLREALRDLLDHREAYSNRSVDFDAFRWGAVSDFYARLYDDDLNC